MPRRKYGRGIQRKGIEANAYPEITHSLERELSDDNIVGLKDKILHYTLYSTDGYINTEAGIWPPVNDNTLIAGWGSPDIFAGGRDYAGPVYIWGFTDLDPNIAGNTAPVPDTVLPGVKPANNFTGNAKFPAPFLECKVNEHVFVTVHNRGFYQNEQTVQDDHSLHFHGIHAQAPYDGFPESAGGYVENLRYFWEEDWYRSLNNPGINPGMTTARQRDDWWNALSLAKQISLLNTHTPLIKENRLNPGGGITNQFNNEDYPLGVTDPDTHLPFPPERIEEITQFTYYITPVHMGTYMYHCHVAASEHVQMGMYGALIVRPGDGSKSVFGKGTNTDYDDEYTLIISEFDPRWHRNIETDGEVFGDFMPSDWTPELWFANGRTFPTTLLDFKWNMPDTATDPVEYYREPRYNTYIKTAPKRKILIRYIHMGYQSQPMHQHGWHMRVVGKDARPVKPQNEVYTLFIGSGETYDTITLADPAYGVTSPAGSPLSSPHPDSPSCRQPNGTLKWRIIYPIHSHDDYKVTTNGIYPGGGLVLIEACVDPKSVPLPKSVPPFGDLGQPTFENPYVMDTPIDLRTIEEVPAPSSCPGLPPKKCA